VIRVLGKVATVATVRRVRSPVFFGIVGIVVLKIVWQEQWRKKMSEESITGMASVRKSIGMQIECPKCRRPFDARAFDYHIGCNYCGIFIEIGYPYILGNVCQTNQAYLEVVRACKRYIKEKENE